MNFSVNAPGHRAEKEARILPAVVKTRNQYSNTAPRFPLVAHLSGCARRARAYSAAMNAEPPSSSVLSSLWQQIRAVLEHSGVTLLDAADMHEAVALATQRAHAGDAVLMSPACASFDMFDNYPHRARVFREAVQAVAREAGVDLEEAA